VLPVQATAKSTIEGGRSGSIITIASIGGKHPDAGSVAYSVSKAGVWMFTKSAARDLASLIAITGGPIGADPLGGQSLTRPRRAADDDGSKEHPEDQ
jgi:NAD(P)-dependent dehydrogenase (short-subunit alcohol dehydrogenase family)